MIDSFTFKLISEIGIKEVYKQGYLVGVTTLAEQK